MKLIIFTAAAQIYVFYRHSQHLHKQLNIMNKFRKPPSTYFITKHIWATLRYINLSLQLTTVLFLYFVPFVINVSIFSISVTKGNRFLFAPTANLSKTKDQELISMRVLLVVRKNRFYIHTQSCCITREPSCTGCFTY